MASSSLEKVAPSTPPPPTNGRRIHTPPTPRFGSLYDDWEPYTPRKSARLSAKKAAITRTPSPSALPRSLALPKTASPRTTSKMPRISSSATRNAAKSTGSPAHHAADDEDDATNAVLPSESKGLTTAQAAQAAAAAMYPTPSKTPSNRKLKLPAAELKDVSRTIFRRADKDKSAPPSSTAKRGKKYTGISLESFRVENIDEEIPIYTDTNERIPEVDLSADNPFYGPGARAGAVTRSQTRRNAKVNIPDEGVQDLEDVLHRDDGILFVFRGKKRFRKFKDVGENVNDDGTSRPLTRSSIKPRLLFPPKPVVKDEAEEASTVAGDDADQSATAKDDAVTPAEIAEEKPTTPKALKFAPVSPPTTARTTRAVNKPAESLQLVGPAKPSPFAGWRRSKNTSSSTGTKRRAEPLERDQPKRARSTT